MDTPEKSSSILPLSALLLALGLGGYYLYEHPYESLRPRETVEPRSYGSSEDVDARLWEDPFSAVYRADGLSPCGDLRLRGLSEGGEEERQRWRTVYDAFREAASHQVQQLAHDLRVRSDDPHARHRGDTGRIVLLPVLLPGGPYAEQVERRRRARHAVLAGLGVAGYVPEVSDRIGYVEPCWDFLGRLDPDSGRPVAVPYEWLQADRLRPSTDPDRPGAVLVLWLDEDELGDQPLHRIDELLRFLVGFVPANAEVEDPPRRVSDRYHFAVIGPATSGVLKKMLAEPAPKPEPCPGATTESDPRPGRPMLARCLARRFRQPPAEGRMACPEASDAEGETPPTVAVEPPTVLADEILRVLRTSEGAHASAVSYADRTAHLLEELTGRVAASDERDVGWADTAAIAEETGRWIAENRAALLGSVEPGGSLLDRVVVYGSRSTAPAALLLAEHPEAGRQGAGGSWNAALTRQLEAGPGVRYVSAIGRDDELAEALVLELGRRGVDLCDEDGRDHLALVGEWDTVFGRSLPLAFEAAILACRGAAGAATVGDGLLALVDGRVAPPARVERYNYLRGLDGVASRPERGDRDPDDEAERAASRDDGGGGIGLPWPGRRTVERPVGNRQFDYMRRLAGQLSDRDRALRRSGERIRAVGVVGSDVYDKLLVLQALRERFPQALFFTTDLDSRLVHPADYRWNRNLLVASSFGLSLRGDLQPRVPPFRDSYQTATFLAVQLALADAGGSDRSRPRPPGWTPTPRTRTPRPVPAVVQGSPRPADRAEGVADLPARDRLLLFARHPWLDPAAARTGPGPRVFEVARSGPYDLTPDRDRWGFHPPRRPARPQGKKLGGAAGVSALALLLLVPVVPGLRRYTLGRWSDTDHRELFYVNLMTLLVVITGLVFWRVVHVATRDAAGEPFELWEGISIWPTEGLRLVAALLALFFVALGTVKLKRNVEEIERRYGLEPGPRREWRSCWSRWWRARRTIKARWHGRSWFYGFAELKPLGLGKVLTHAARPLLRERRTWWRRRQDVSINAWRCSLATRKPMERTKAEASPALGAVVWERYRYLGRLGHRLTRFLPVAFLYWLLAQGIMTFLGRPVVPFRGEVARTADLAILMASVFGIIALTFFVVDATRLCERFIHALADRRTEWPPEVLDEAVERWQVDRKDAADFLDLEIIADRTEAVGKLILYPFLILFLMIVSRVSVFDDWDWPLSLLLILAMASGYALMCAVVLRRAAEGARGRAIERLRANLFEAVRKEERGDGPRASQIRLLIEEARRLRRGAFAHWTHHPVVRAVLLPFGGIGAVALIELLVALSR